MDVPQLPRVAVVAASRAAASRADDARADDARAEAVCAALVDAGLDAVRATGTPTASTASTPSELSGLADALARATPDNSGVGSGCDVTVVVTAGAAPDDRFATRFGGVFLPDRDGVYVVGAAPLAGARGAGAASDRETMLAQARWLGEYLRGRYLLPQRSEMLAHLGLRPTPVLSRLARPSGRTHDYRRRLALEVRRGRARAAAAGYPLPVPATTEAKLLGTPDA